MDSAVILLSGGFGSTTAAYCRRDNTRLFPLYVNYGRASAAEERAAASAIAENLGATLQVLDLPHVLQISRSPDVRHPGQEGRPGPPNEVAGLATTILSVGAEYAAAVGAHTLITGHSAAAQDVALHEVSRERRVDVWAFRHAFAAMLEPALPKVRSLKLDTPLLDLEAAQIVQLGRRAAVPFELSWSCHQKTAPCGTCPGCVFRSAAFAGAGLPDPLTQPAAR